MQGQKILVTGATGFTGGHLARRLVSEGASVRCLVRDPAALPEDLKASVSPVIGDLTDMESISAAVQGCHSVYHIAAHYRTEGVPDEHFFKVNAEGTRHIMNACLDHNVARVVHCSTVGVHGHLKQVPGDESAPFAPGDLYQESKLEGERIALAFHKEHGLPVSVFRPTGIYGPGDTRLLKFFKIVKMGRPILGSGRPHYHLTYIDDLVDGIILCGTHEKAVGEVFILAGPEAPTLIEWYNTIARVLKVKTLGLRLPVWPFLAMGAMCEWIFKPFGKEPPIHRRSVHFFTHDRKFDISKAQNLLGYKPKTDLKTGMKITADWYQQNGLL